MESEINQQEEEFNELLCYYPPPPLLIEDVLFNYSSYSPSIFRGESRSYSFTFKKWFPLRLGEEYYSISIIPVPEEILLDGQVLSVHDSGYIFLGDRNHKSIEFRDPSDKEFHVNVYLKDESDYASEIRNKRQKRDNREICSQPSSPASSPVNTSTLNDYHTKVLQLEEFLKDNLHLYESGKESQPLTELVQIMEDLETRNDIPPARLSHDSGMISVIENGVKRELVCEKGVKVLPISRNNKNVWGSVLKTSGLYHDSVKKKD